MTIEIIGNSPQLSGKIKGVYSPDSLTASSKEGFPNEKFLSVMGRFIEGRFRIGNAAQHNTTQRNATQRNAAQRSASSLLLYWNQP